MIHQPNTTIQILDPLTKSGFEEIQSAFGRDAAFQCKVEQIKLLIVQSRHFRWHSVKWEKLLQRTIFDWYWNDDGTGYDAATCWQAIQDNLASCQAASLVREG